MDTKNCVKTNILIKKNNRQVFLYFDNEFYRNSIRIVIQRIDITSTNQEDVEIQYKSKYSM